MIDLKLSIESSIIKEVKVKGHSNFDKIGKDIVCAGVSTILYSTLNALKKIPDIVFDFIDNDKDFIIKVKNYDKKIEGELRGITLTLISGLKILEKNYSKNIKLKISSKE